MLNSDFVSPFLILHGAPCLQIAALQGFCVLGQGVVVGWVVCFFVSFFPRDLQCKRLCSYLIFKTQFGEAVTMEIKGEGEWTVSP